MKHPGMKCLLALLAALASLIFTASASALEPAPTLSAEGNVLHWTAVSGCTEYRVGYRPAGEGTPPGPFFHGTVGQTLKFTESSWTEGAKAEAEVQCWKPTGKESAWSNVVTVVPHPKAESDLGKVRVAPDTSEWGSYLNSTWKTWMQEHIAVLRLYHGNQGESLSWGLRNYSYRDWVNESTWAPATEANRHAFIKEGVEHDVAEGFGGIFLDDLNWHCGGERNYRDWKQEYGGGVQEGAPQCTEPAGREPEAANMALLAHEVRTAVGSSRLIEANSQWKDVWPLVKAKDASVESLLSQVNIVTKEFALSSTSGITNATLYREYFEWVDTMHGKGIQVRLTGSLPAVTEAEYEWLLSNYFLGTANASSLGGDLVHFSKSKPQTTCTTEVKAGVWWCGANVDLAEATSPRERATSGVWKRTFASGVVYTNEPGNASKTVEISPAKHRINGTSVSSITLAGGQGVVLLP